MKQLLFESWTFEDNILDRDPDEGGAGLYLRPDTRYTDTAWDMVLYWKQDILKSLAEDISDYFSCPQFCSFRQVLF